MVKSTRNMVDDRTLLRGVSWMGYVDNSMTAEARDRAFEAAVSAEIAVMAQYISFAIRNAFYAFKEKRTVAEFISDYVITLASHKGGEPPISVELVSKLLSKWGFVTENGKIQPKVSVRKLRFRQKYVCDITFVINDVAVSEET